MKTKIRYLIKEYFRAKTKTKKMKTIIKQKNLKIPFENSL